MHRAVAQKKFSHRKWAKKKFWQVKNPLPPPPPITFLMVRGNPLAKATLLPCQLTFTAGEAGHRKNGKLSIELTGTYPRVFFTGHKYSSLSCCKQAGKCPLAYYMMFQPVLGLGDTV